MAKKPRDVLDVQVDLVRYLHSEYGEIYVKGFAEHKEEEDSKRDPSIHSKIGGEGLLRRLQFDLDRASTYWVSRDMCALIEHATKSMADQPLLERDMPTTRGFVWLEKIFYVNDIHNERCGIRALSWGPCPIAVSGIPGFEGTNPGVILTYWTDPTDTEDTFVKATQNDPRSTPQMLRQVTGPLVMFHYEPWIFGLGYVNVDEEGNRVPLVAELRQYTQALWTLTQQPLLSHRTREHPDRALARRLRRGGLLVDEPSVEIVTLRRVTPHHDPEEGEGDSVDWSHRWIVDGHWRQQWYPSLNEHRQIWISPFIKGPESKPLVIRDRVYKLSR